MLYQRSILAFNNSDNAESRLNPITILLLYNITFTAYNHRLFYCRDCQYNTHYYDICLQQDGTEQCCEPSVCPSVRPMPVAQHLQALVGKCTTEPGQLEQTKSNQQADTRR